ncbi:hypothetical protein HPO96_10400 [Kribbella sandramycini]|uniref:Uncharacterized protein n=1 Tax=Kribbella sandramycini TaxID=60450 RepID=A0A7Y4P013_9ACTN|nr:hypothetical protein [Kribbella sandramycini]MBB6569511.1 hypothetical protein [Kribbella sandramycini]NOL40655.1 hypothetical protein [Kribbella sandramycini]
MSNDIERLLAAAADDTDRPLHTDLDNILARGRRSVRRGRIAIASAALVSTAALVGGVTAWTGAVAGAADPAGITVDNSTGVVTDNESGTKAVPPPPVSPLSDAEIVKRCKRWDSEALTRHNSVGNGDDKAGPINDRWKVILKVGDQTKLDAMLMSPDQSIVSRCTFGSELRTAFAMRHYTKSSVSAAEDADKSSMGGQPETVESHSRIPAPNVARVLVDVFGEKAPREARVSSDGYFSEGAPDWIAWEKVDPTDQPKRVQGHPRIQRVRAYDAKGKQVYEWKYTPHR